MIARVLPKRKITGSYLLDYKISDRVPLLSLVEVPIRGKNSQAVVFSFAQRSRHNPKPIKRVLSNGSVLTNSQIKFANVLSNEFLSTLNEAAFTMIPTLNISDIKKIGLSRPPDVINRKAQTAALFVGERRSRIELVCQKIQNSGQNVIIFPTIEQVKQSLNEVKKICPNKNILPWHSKLASHEKASVWQKLIRGSDVCVIGTRHALFLPFTKLREIFIDDPTNFAYHDDQAPYYNAYSAAKILSKISGASLNVATNVVDLNTYIGILRDRFKIIETNQTIDILTAEGWTNKNQEIIQKIKRGLPGNQRLCVIGPWQKETKHWCFDCQNKITIAQSDNTRCPLCRGIRTKEFGFSYSQITRELKEIFPEFANQISADPNTFAQAKIALVRLGEIDFLKINFSYALFPYFKEMIDFPYLNYREKIYRGVFALKSTGVESIILFGENLEKNEFIKFIITNNWRGFLNGELKNRIKLCLPPATKSVLLIAKSKDENSAKKTVAQIKKLLTLEHIFIEYDSQYKRNLLETKALICFQHKYWPKFKKIHKSLPVGNYHFEVDPIEFS